MLKKTITLTLSLLCCFVVASSAFASTLPITDHRKCNEIAGESCKSSDADEEKETPPAKEDDDGISPPDCDFACDA